jgi:hypothetical protein
VTAAVSPIRIPVASSFGEVIMSVRMATSLPLARASESSLTTSTIPEPLAAHAGVSVRRACYRVEMIDAAAARGTIAHHAQQLRRRFDRLRPALVGCGLLQVADEGVERPVHIVDYALQDGDSEVGRQVEQ